MPTSDGLILQDARRTYTFYMDDDLIDTFGPHIGAYGLAVYAFLARHAKEQQCFPSYKRMCEKLGLSRQTITRTLKRLADVGLIIKHKRRTAAGDPDTNLYTLCDLSHLHRQRGTSPEDVRTSSDYLRTSPQDRGTSPEDGGVGNVGTEGTSPGRLEGISLKESQGKGEEPLCLPSEDISPPAITHRALPVDYSPGFLAVWQVYPTTRRASKPRCYQIWKTARLEGRAAEIVAKIERLKATIWLRIEPQFIPLSSTWFGGGRWDDDLVPLTVLQ